MRIEVRSGFCDPDGELLAVLDRPGWQRVTARRKSELVDELAGVCDKLGIWEVEAWLRGGDGGPRFVIGYWHT